MPKRPQHGKIRWPTLLQNFDFLPKSICYIANIAMNEQTN